MTHPNIVSIVMGCFVFFALIAFVIANMMLGFKRLMAWWDSWQNRRHPPSVQVTLNQMNIGSEEQAYRLARHTRIEKGRKP